MPLKSRWPNPLDTRIQNDRTPEDDVDKAESSQRASAAVEFNNIQAAACQRNERERVQRLITPAKKER
ncbi:MAG: hypothetical protein ABSG38_16430 [Spirochaetia bacterium]|jgi:hypothetical protein